MSTLEESILIALLNGNDDEAESLIAGMLPSERRSLRHAAVKLQSMLAAAPTPEVKP